jgi:DNA end-binding protein Ku
LDKLKAKIADDMLAMAEQIIGQKEMTFDPAAFEDRYENAVLELVKSKISGGEPVIAKAPERGNVVNLMDALRRSIEEERRPPAPSLGKAAASKGAATKTAASAKVAAAPVKKAKKTA